jgi:hypothetical protein
LGIVNAPTRNGGMTIILFKMKEDTNFPPPWVSTYFVNIIASLKTFSIVSMSLGGSLLRKIEVNESIIPK